MMHKRIVFTVLLASMAAAFAREPLPAGVEKKPFAERIEHFSFRSAALDKKMTFTVVYPKDFDPSRTDWPVLFMLHGLGRHERTLVEDEETRAMLLDQPYVIVLPKGENGWYFDSVTDPQRKYAANLDETIALAEKILPISREKGRRAIGGWSAGGFGSVWACIRHPDSFSTLATVIAVVDHPSPESNFPIPENMFGTDPKEWEACNPIHRAAELKGLNILLVIGDKATDAKMNNRLSDELAKNGIANKTLHLPGGHTFPTVKGGVERILEFVKESITPALGPSTQPQ